MDSGTFIDNEKQKYQFLDLSKYQGIDKNISVADASLHASFFLFDTC
jgi:beta-N-acetylglucosaminidase